MIYFTGSSESQRLRDRVIILFSFKSSTASCGTILHTKGVAFPLPSHAVQLPRCVFRRASIRLGDFDLTDYHFEDRCGQGIPEYEIAAYPSMYQCGALRYTSEQHHGLPCRWLCRSSMAMASPLVRFADESLARKLGENCFGGCFRQSGESLSWPCLR